MNGVKTLTLERIAEIKAFKNTDFSDCPVLTEEELKKMKPRHPEYFRPVKKAVQIRLDADVLAWFKAYGKGYQSRINAALRDVMLQTTERHE
ncbi:BrnA antitoxin family protein [Treponema primitia]|uniref:BrnA antitoxin family protein n=1 Tax=Treponema primitia TaxID=88058 RepID=UPI000255512F|nr:BrnA antitoxin family protein [Treponema primitia]